MFDLIYWALLVLNVTIGLYLVVKVRALLLEIKAKAAAVVTESQDLLEEAKAAELVQITPSAPTEKADTADSSVTTLEDPAMHGEPGIMYWGKETAAPLAVEVPSKKKAKPRTKAPRKASVKKTAT